MKRLSYFVSAIALSFILYLTVFSYIHKPLTIDFIKETIEKKKAYGVRSTSPKFIIIAGSNGRFSHRCETIEQIIKVPCVNGAVAAGIDIEFMLEQYKSILQPGDVIYMPWEYNQYKDTQETFSNGPDNALLVHFYRNQLMERPLAEIVRAYLWFDVSFLIQGAVEMGLARRGFARRFNLDTLTNQGDERGHTIERGKDYEKHIQKANWIAPDLTAIGDNARSIKILREFMKWASQHNILIIGGLPTTFEDRPVVSEVVNKIAAIYTGSGHCFLILPNHSQYPRHCFYDTPFHLNETCQIEHSKMLAEFIQKRWPFEQGCAMLAE